MTIDEIFVDDGSVFHTPTDWVLTVWCFRGAFVVLLWCFCGASVVLPWCFCGASVVLLWCFCGASVVLLWCFCGASEVYKVTVLFYSLSMFSCLFCRPCSYNRLQHRNTPEERTCGVLYVRDQTLYG